MKFAFLYLLMTTMALRAQTMATNDAAGEGPASGGKYAPTVYPTNVRVETNLPYLGPGRSETADVYSPLQRPRDVRLPAILIIHGGGFNDGDKARPREINIATNLVLQGYVCMSINYKLRRKAGDVTWPQAIYDAKAAVRWLRKSAAALQVDPEHIGVIGCSAGGNLAAMLALTQPKDGFDLQEPNGDCSSAVSCGVDFYGAVNLLDYHDMKMFNRTRAEAPELYRQASPVTYAHANAAPMLLVHGTADTTVPVAQSEALDAALAQAGAVHELVIVPDAPHTFNLQPKQRDLRPLVFDFFARHLQGPGGSPTSGHPKAGPVLPDDVRVEQGVNYLPTSRTQQADLYFPKEMPPGKKLPAVVLIHGGGWATGKRDAAREVNCGTTFARHGYVVMSIDYLLSDHKQAVWPTNLWDCKTAVRWLRQNAARLGVDAENIGVMGGSAGGHLAAMVALTAPADGLDPVEPFGGVSCAVKCCVDFYGIADLGTYHDVTMLGKTFAEAPGLYRAASPVTYIRGHSPPVLICHGTADTTVNPQQSKLFDEALTRAGVEHHLEVIPNAVHTFDLQPPQRDLRPLVLQFLDAHLKGK